MCKDVDHSRISSAAQIRNFCSRYQQAKPSYKSKYQSQYKQYCVNTTRSNVISPTITKPISTTLKPALAKVSGFGLPNCLKNGSTIRVIGQYFSANNVVCEMHPKLGLRRSKQTASSLTFNLTEKPQSGAAYSLRCSAGQQALSSRRLQLCVNRLANPAKKNVIAPRTTTFVDLAGQIKLQPSLQKDVLQQSIKINYRNLGNGTSDKFFTIDIVLKKQKKVTKRLIRRFNLEGEKLVLYHIRGKSVPAPGTLQTVFAKVQLPVKLTPGQYLWCAYFDAGNHVAESNENNNSNCQRLTIGTAASISGPGIQGVFGAKLRNKAAPGNKIHQLIQTLPADLHTLDGEVPMLTLNERILGPVGVPAAGPAQLSWVVPATAGDQLYLLISASDHYDCPVGPLETQRSVLEAMSATVPDGGVKSPSGDLSLSLASYSQGNPYYLWGCVLRSGALTGIKTNRLVMNYAFLTVATTVTAELPPLVLTPPDLEIRQFRRIGHDHLMFWVSAKTSGSRPAPAGAFFWKIFFIRPTVFYTINHGSRLSRLTDDGLGVRIYQGQAHVRNLSLFGYGDALTTNFTIPDTGPWVVVLTINTGLAQSAIQYGSETNLVRELGSGEGSLYRESNYGNNNQTLLIGDPYTAFGDSIIDLQLVHSGEGWAVFDLRYLKRSHGGATLTLELNGASTLLRGAGETLPAPIDCVDVRDSVTDVTSYVGDQVVRFYCRRPEGNSGNGRGATARLTTWLPEQRTLARRSYDTSLDWGLENHGTGLPDLVASIGTVSTGPGGYGGSVEVTVQNEGDVEAHNVTTDFKLKAWGPYGAVRNQQTNRFASVRPGQAITRRLQIPGAVMRVDHTNAHFTVDPELAMMEEDETNNTAIKSMPAAAVAGSIVIQANRFATDQHTSLHRGDWCLGAVGGHAWPAEMHLPGADTVLVGYRVDYNGGVCSTRWVFDAYGHLGFDLERFRPLSFRLRRATMRFQRTGAPAPSNCHGSPVHNIGAATRNWDSSGPDSTLPHTRFSASVSSYSSGNLQADVTSAVQALIADGGRYFGFLVTGSSIGHQTNLTMNCAAYYGNFELTLEIGE